MNIRFEKIEHPRRTPMAMSLQQARLDVQKAADEAIAFIDSDEPKTLRQAEEGLWPLLMAFGQALVLLYLVKRTATPRSAFYEHEGKSLVILGTYTGDVATIFGKVRWSRPTARLAGKLGPVEDLPIDREIGLTGGFSLSVIERIGRLSAQMSFDTALRMFERVYGWAPCSRSQLRMVDALGQLARPFLEQCPAPEDDGEILVGQVDAGGSPTISRRELKRRKRKRKDRSKSASPPMTERDQRKQKRQSNPKPRRTKGKKSKNAKMAVVGVIYTLRRTSMGLEGPINKRVIGTFTSHEELFVWFHNEMVKRGYGTKKTYFLADGCPHIWRYQKKYLPEAIACMDWYHVVEKLWIAGKCLYSEGSRKLSDWVDVQKRRLRYGHLNALLNCLNDALSGISKRGPGNKSRRKRLSDVIKHLTKNRDRLIYARMRRHGVDIGSGAVEGAVRNLVRMRLDGPGRRWGRGRDERVLHLRCILLNNQWEDFVDFVESKAVKLPPKPLEAEAHEARKKAA